MVPDFFHCEVCGKQLVGNGSTARRIYQDPIAKTGLISVRCAECTGLPYPLEEGQPCRSEWPVEGGCLYSYWSRGIGHLLELELSTDEASFIRTLPLELGFLVRAEANLIIVAFRFASDEWIVTPYLWRAYPAGHRGVPSMNPEAEVDRKFSVALVDFNARKYCGILVRTLPIAFATAFHGAINDQIGRGIPQSGQYREEVGRLHELQDNKVDSMLNARCKVQDLMAVQAAS